MRINSIRQVIAATMLSFLLSLQMLYAQQHKEKKYKVNFDQTPYAVAFDTLKKLTNCKFFFTYDQLPPSWKISYKGEGSLREILQAIIAGTSLQVEIIGLEVYIKSKPIITLSVTVINREGDPLAGVTITRLDSNLLGATGPDGRWQLATRSIPLRLALSFVGYRSDTITVYDHAVVTLQKKFSEEEEAIAIGYGSTSLRKSVGSIVKVSAREIAGKPYRSVIDLLRMATGLLITSKTDIPWGGYSIEIRGSRTILPLSPGRRIDEPLILLDEVPCVGCTGFLSQLSSVVGDPNGTGAGLNPLAFLQVDDIESVTIMKDGLATAIYGARGANGVILISLRKAEKDRFRITASATVGQAQAYGLVEPLTTQQYLGMRREALRNANLLSDPDAAPDFRIDTTGYTNWAKELYRNPARNIAARLSASGRHNQFYWLLSMNYNKAPYVYPTAAYDEWTRLYFNSGYQSRNNKFTVNTYGAAAVGNIVSPAWDLGHIIYALPHLPAKSPETGYATDVHPQRLFNSQYRSRSNHLFSQMQLSYRFGTLVTMKLHAGIGRQELLEKAVFPKTSLMSGQYEQARKQVLTWITEPQASLQWGGDKIKTNILVGANIQGTEQRSMQRLFKGYTSDSALFRDAVYPAIDTAWTQYRLVSMFTRVNLELWDQWILEGTFRRDGSTRFAQGHRWGNFFALGGAWVFSEVPFLKKRRTGLTFGKLRVTYGRTGSDQVDDYAYMGQWQPSNVAYPYGDLQGLVQALPMNERLQWQITQKKELGLTLEWWNKLRMDATFYVHRSYDQIISRPLASQGGFPAVKYWNFPAVVENSGWEFALTFKSPARRKLRTTVSLSYTIPKNKLISFHDLDQVLQGGGLLVGHALSARPVYHALPMDAGTGTYPVADMDGNGTITPNDKQVFKDLEVKGFGVGQVTLQLGPWALICTIEGRVQPGYSARYHNNNRLYPGMLEAVGFSNQPGFLFSHEKPGAYQQLSAAPRAGQLDSLQRYQDSDGAYTDQSYISLRQLSFQYTMKRAWLKRLHLHEIQFYAQAYNLFVISSYDGGNPQLQTPFSQPATRQYTVGVQLAFIK